jgi:hypothetical protein
VEIKLPKEGWDEYLFQRRFGYTATDLLKEHYTTSPNMSPEELYAGINVDEVCEELANQFYRLSTKSFTEEVCLEGYKLITSHVSGNLKGMIGNHDMSSTGNTLNTCTGCRPDKFSLHIIAPYVWCKSVTVSMPILAWEMSRSLYTSNSVALITTPLDELKDPNALTEFRIRMMMIDKMGMPVNRRRSTVTRHPSEEIVFESRDDTPFDHNVYQDYHLLRGPFSKKVTGNAPALAPIINTLQPGPMMTSGPRICALDDNLSVFPIYSPVTKNQLDQAVMTFIDFRKYTVTAQGSDQLSSRTHVLFFDVKVTPSYPNPTQYETARLSSVNPAPGKAVFEGQSTVLDNIAYEKHIANRTTDHRSVQMLGGDFDFSRYLTNNMNPESEFADAEIISPTDLIYVETNGVFLPLVACRHGTWAFHDHLDDGVYESRSSLRVYHRQNFLALKCYSCGFIGSCIPKEMDPRFFYHDDEIVRVENSDVHIGDIAYFVDPAKLPKTIFKKDHPTGNKGIDWVSIITSKAVTEILSRPVIERDMQPYPSSSYRNYQ